MNDDSENDEDSGNEFGELFEDFMHKIPDLPADLASGWKSEIHNPTLHEFVLDDLGLTGISENIDLPAEANAKACFDLFCNIDMLEKICEETNLYAEQTIEKDIDNGIITPGSFCSKWTPVQRNEMVRFLTLCLLMGIVHKPRIRDYWSIDSLLETPIFPKYMARNRFQAILKFLHLNDQSEFPPRKNDDGSDNEHYDSLYKIRPFFDSLMLNSKTVYTPRVNIAIDETMIGLSRPRLVSSVHQKQTRKIWYKIVHTGRICNRICFGHDNLHRRHNSLLASICRGVRQDRSSSADTDGPFLGKWLSLIR